MAGVGHVFNPDHDIALAFGKEGFTPPAAGRGMRNDLAFLPAIWAEKGDLVVADNPDLAKEMAKPLKWLLADVDFVAMGEMKNRAADGFVVRPWGWNRALRHQLSRAGIPEDCLPSKEGLDRLRRMSHRATSIPLLHTLVDGSEAMVGERADVTDIDDLQRLDEKYGRMVLKAPWSSSGRGVRFVEKWSSANVMGFARNVIARQGSIIVEPCYERVMDFAMEFVADGMGMAEYRGLSLFHTVNGAYVGNLLAPEEEKWQILAQHIDSAALHQVRNVVEKVVGEWCRNCYDGPFGVDMMVVRQQQGFALHPCVEVNLRRTMGHVALDVAKKTQGQCRVMRVAYENGTYRLRLE